DGPGAPTEIPTEIPAEFGLEATEDFCERLLSMADAVSDEPAASPAVSTEQPRFSAILESLTRHMEVESAAGPAIRMPAPEPRPVIDNRALARIGLPEDLRRAALANPAPAAGTDPAAWLIGLLADLPRPAPLPQGQGSVIVVVGAREAALNLARSLSDELGLDRTVSPATVLQCGIPVGRLEGRPATPALWAALLAPRLAI